MRTIGDYISLINEIDNNIDELLSLSLKFSQDETTDREREAVDKATGFILEYKRLLMLTEVKE